MSSSNCENVPLMFKIDACIELVQTKFMDYSPIKKDLFYNYGILLEILSYFAKFYNSVTNIENCAIFYSPIVPILPLLRLSNKLSYWFILKHSLKHLCRLRIQRIMNLRKVSLSNCVVEVFSKASKYFKLYVLKIKLRRIQPITQKIEKCLFISITSFISPHLIISFSTLNQSLYTGTLKHFLNG